MRDFLSTATAVNAILLSFPVKLSEDYNRRGFLPGLEAAVDSHPVAPAPRRAAPGAPAPVEYAVAVDRYLGQAALGVASRRVYRVSLASWAWPLVGKPTPAGPQRRGALAPVVPLALLEDPGTTGRLASALA